MASPSKYPCQIILVYNPSMKLLEGFFKDASQLYHYVPVDGLQTFKTGPLDNPLEFGQMKKVTRSQLK